MSNADRLKEIDLDSKELREFRKKSLEFERLAQTPGSVVNKKLQPAYDALWTTAEIREQKRALERASEFLKQSEVN